jgi:hypothetical protein
MSVFAFRTAAAVTLGAFAVGLLGCAHSRSARFTKWTDRTAESNLACIEDPSRSPVREPPESAPSAAAGPRCDGRKGPCGPIQARGATLAAAGYRCDAPRKPIETKRGSCAHDGECGVVCEQDCVAWTEPQPEACRGAIIFVTQRFCGCVTGSCTWFVQ